MFETDSSPVVWDGKVNDQEMLPGVYVYLVKLEYPDPDQEIRFISGSLTLIR